MKKIGILLINYNGLEDTCDCIDSIYKYNSDEEVTIIVVDNASHNNEADALSVKYNNIHVLSLDKNTGFAKGNNIGIQYALKIGVDYVLILNNDTVICENTISELVSNMEADCICAPKIMCYMDKDKIWYGGGKVNFYTGNATNVTKKALSEKPLYCTFATGCCVLIDCEIIKKYGGFEEKFFMYCEDEELCLRYKQNGIKIKYVPTAYLYHKESRSTGGGGSALSTYYSTRNRLYCIDMYKSEFKRMTITFIYVSRLIRIIQYFILGKRQWKAIYYGLKDYRQGKSGPITKEVAIQIME